MQNIGRMPQCFTVTLCCAVVWRESVVVGETDMNRQEVQEVVQQLGNEYRGNAYHLLERNCNHFTDDLAFKLTGNHAPPWVRSIYGLHEEHAIYTNPCQRSWRCLSGPGCLQPASSKIKFYMLQSSARSHNCSWIAILVRLPAPYWACYSVADQQISGSGHHAALLAASFVGASTDAANRQNVGR